MPRKIPPMAARGWLTLRPAHTEEQDAGAADHQQQDKQPVELHPEPVELGHVLLGLLQLILHQGADPSLTGSITR